MSGCASFEIVLKYLSGNLELDCFDSAYAGFQAGHRYHVPDLVRAASTALTKHISTGTVLYILQACHHCLAATRCQPPPVTTPPSAGRRLILTTPTNAAGTASASSARRKASDADDLYQPESALDDERISASSAEDVNITASSALSPAAANKQLITCTNSCSRMYSKCLQYIDKHARGVIKQSCWLRLPIQLVSEIISRDTLRIDSELLIVDGLLRWMVKPKFVSKSSSRNRESETDPLSLKSPPPAACSCNKQTRDSRDTRDSNTGNSNNVQDSLLKCRCSLQGAQYLVRYLNVSLQDFKKGVKGRGLLSIQEEESIENCLRSPNTQLPEHLEQLRYLMSAPRKSHEFVSTKHLRRKRGALPGLPESRSRVRPVHKPLYTSVHKVHSVQPLYTSVHNSTAHSFTMEEEETQLIVPKDKMSLLDEVFLCLACFLD